MMKSAKTLVPHMIFLKNAIVSSKKKRSVVNQIIWDLVPQFFDPNGKFFHIFIIIYLIQ